MLFSEFEHLISHQMHMRTVCAFLIICQRLSVRFLPVAGKTKSFYTIELKGGVLANTFKVKLCSLTTKRIHSSEKKRKSKYWFLLSNRLIKNLTKLTIHPHVLKKKKKRKHAGLEKSLNSESNTTIIYHQVCYSCVSLDKSLQQFGLLCQFLRLRNKRQQNLEAGNNIVYEQEVLNRGSDFCQDVSALLDNSLVGRMLEKVFT